ncbi:MAG: alpha-amylase [Muribaculaceae bacterium]|nr:alpha-amylase [Muribaculaceae bacterium]
MKKILALLFGICGTAVANAAPDTTVDHPDWSRDAVIYEVNVRQFTPEGTLSSFSRELPRLRDLGVDILWFMPMHPISQEKRKGTLGSYYAVADYKALNPEFGTMDEFKKVVDQAHALGMKVIIDWVPNHTGCDNIWVSSHPEYYARNEKGEMFGPFDWTDTYKLDYSNPDTRAAMIDAMSFWITDAGVDGFRCDVAGQVPVDFWNEARPALDKAAGGRPVFMLAEATEPELMEHAFDMDYNWPMKDLFSAIAATSGQYTFIAPGETAPKSFPESHASDIVKLVRQQEAEYPGDSYMMNMTSNHDLNSWEGTEFERLGNLSRAFAVLSYTLPGMPLIYTGQEVGLNRALEFFEKDEAPDWTSKPAMTEFYRTLNELKHSRPELAAGKHGAPMEVFATDSDDLLVFSRRSGTRETVVAVNLGKKPELLTFKGATPVTEGAVNVFTGAAATLPASLEPGEVVLLTINR